MSFFSQSMYLFYQNRGIIVSRLQPPRKVMTTNFSYSKTIRPKRTDGFIYDATLKNRLNKFRGHSLDKPIHIYRMWWHLVRLVMDCEKHNIVFGGEKEQKVKLDKKFYKEWEMDKYLDSSFDDWMQDKIHLFAEQQASIVKEGEVSEDYLYIKFNKRQRKEDVIRQVRSLLKDGMFQTESKFPVKQQYKYFYLHQQYNAFILRQDGVSGMEVADWMVKEYKKYNARISTSYSSMRRLYRASEQLVVDVSKGNF